MIQRFVLDENVVILAQKVENQRNERDSSCRDLFDRIIEICHTLVVDPSLWDKYYRQLTSLRRHDPHGPRSILRILYLATQREGKLQTLRGNAPPFTEEESIPQGSQDDVPIVRLVVETGATLVTTDEALRDDLNSCGVQERYDLQLLAPDQVLATL